MQRLIPLSLMTLLLAAPALAQVPPPSAPPVVKVPTMAPPPGVPAPTGVPAPNQATPRPSAQTPTPPAQAPRAEAPAPRAPFLQGPNMQEAPPSTNIKFDLVITDTFTGAPVKKSVSLLVLTGNSGMIRTANTMLGGLAQLDVDAVARAYQNGMVSTRITFQYQPAPTTEGDFAGKRPPSLNESITVVLMDGKPMTISQSADPATDRRVTAELTATILK